MHFAHQTEPLSHPMSTQGAQTDMMMMMMMMKNKEPIAVKKLRP
jgi:hypothetical protein